MEQFGLVTLFLAVLYLSVRIKRMSQVLKDTRRRLEDLELAPATFPGEVQIKAQSAEILPSGVEQITSQSSVTDGEELLARVLAELNQERQDSPMESRSQSASSHQVIVSRTSRDKGPSLDTWRSERHLDPDEVDELLEMHASGANVAQIATSLKIDSKDVVYAVARRVFCCTGDLEDLSSAENNRRNWTTAQLNRVGALVRQGRPVDQIAREYGRTQLAIVWQCIDNGFAPRG